MKTPKKGDKLYYMGNSATEAEVLELVEAWPRRVEGRNTSAILREAGGREILCYVEFLGRTPDQAVEIQLERYASHLKAYQADLARAIKNVEEALARQKFLQEYATSLKPSQSTPNRG